MDAKLLNANRILGTGYISWFGLSKHKSLSEKFIREFKDDVNWYLISIYQHLSEDFIREFKDKVDWCEISVYQHLSDDFIREFKDDVNWYCISEYQHLSEDFIREFNDKVDWDSISVYQHLSEDFIREFKDKIIWYRISKYQHLSDDFCEEFIITKNDDSWLYKDAEYKKQKVINSGLYECYDDYFIAYKGIRSDRYSNYNFQYRYIKGRIYESWCDCTKDENSFGLSVWTEEKAREYCSELVVKVKVRYEDVGRMVRGNGKIRCFKLEVLE